MNSTLGISLLSFASSVCGEERELQCDAIRTWDRPAIHHPASKAPSADGSRFNGPDESCCLVMVR